MPKNEAGTLLVYILSYFKSKISAWVWGVIPQRVTPCVLVTEEIAEPGKADTFCATWLALPPLNVCSPPTSLASGPPLILSIQIRPPTSMSPEIATVTEPVKKKPSAGF